MTGFKTERRKNLKKRDKTIVVHVGKHFKDRFVERWGNQLDIVKYLNEQLNEGTLVSDVVSDNGLYFPTAGVYVPLSTQHRIQKKYFAITFQFKSIREHHNPITVQWIEYKKEEA